MQQSVLKDVFVINTIMHPTYAIHNGAVLNNYSFSKVGQSSRSDILV